jgi:hypothetical protein
MASIRIIRAALDRSIADSAQEELERFIQIHSPGVVQKEQGKVYYFDAQLKRKTSELQISRAAVEDVLPVSSACRSFALSLRH